jgi:glycosyltransferase involved in cell wall biosynthesis
MAKVTSHLVPRKRIEIVDQRATPRFSLIIPAYNEQNYLPALLDTVETACANYQDGNHAIEVIVADNGSTDSTAKIARFRGCRVVREEKRIIAAVRNAGAAVAQGEILAFVDADSRIHPNTFNAIDHAASNDRVIAGATGVHLERMSLGIAVTYMVMVPLIWVTGMDTGVVFCWRNDFMAIGGYDEQKLFAEDVDLLWRLRRSGRSRGQKLIRVTSTKAVASLRKFDQHGDWHYFSVIVHASGDPGVIPLH